MADDYIRKQDAIDALDRIFDNVPMELTTEILRLRRELRGLSPADVAPVVHAHWYILEYESLTCSRCSGFYYTGCDSTTEAKERLKEGIYPKYCPNCGAKMDGGKNT